MGIFGIQNRIGDLSKKLLHIMRIALGSVHTNKDML